MAVWQRLIEEREKLERNKDKTRILIAIVEIAFPFASLASVLVFWIFYWDVVRVSDIFPFVIALLLLSSTAQDLAFAVFEAFSAFPVMKKGEKIFMEPKEMGEADPGKLKGAISFKNVSFRFEKEAPLLFDDISFEINARERVGILGESGSGRSTLIRLILGFETPENGVIALDERDLSTLRLKEVRRQIGSVFGVEGIFGASIFDNIDAGRGCTEDQIEKALNHSGFAEQMKRFPMGLHTLLPDGGETLSGSQKQKLLLARALAFDPAIIIIDETIDTLDLLSKEAILANLRGIAATQLIVSHDEELLRKHVDKIYKLDHGKIKCQR